MRSQHVCSHCFGFKEEAYMFYYELTGGSFFTDDIVDYYVNVMLCTVHLFKSYTFGIFTVYLYSVSYT